MLYQQDQTNKQTTQTMARIVPFSSHSNTWHQIDSILNLLNKWVDGMDNHPMK